MTVTLILFPVGIGRDLKVGCEWGTWLAIGAKNGTIRVAALLNVTGEKVENAQGRGSLVAEYVANDVTNIDYVQQVRKSGLRYNGYNLVLTEIRYTQFQKQFFFQQFNGQFLFFEVTT